MRKKTILIIEDDRNLALILQEALSKEGYEVEICCEGEGGYKRILKRPPDLLLLDILLPKLFGLELLERIRRNRNKKIASLPVVIITNYPETEYYKKAEKLKVKGFITKADYDLVGVIKEIKKII